MQTVNSYKCQKQIYINQTATSENDNVQSYGVNHITNQHQQQ